MVRKDDGEILTRVGPGTAMGEFMRQHWIPAFMSSELPHPNGPPMRVRLLGENLVAIRVTSGNVGLLAHACAHRGVSLFYGRNEEEGLRCVYHGWKYRLDGQCVDMPAEPPEDNFKDRIRIAAYPCVERNGIVWAYMGPREEPPPLPDIEPNMMPESKVLLRTVMRDCNWLQSLEGDIDHAHESILHYGHVSAKDLTPGTFEYYTRRDWAPRYNVIDTDFGTSYGIYRPVEENNYYWRIAHFLFPFYTMVPTGVLGVQVLVRVWVPIDDEHTMFWSIPAPGSSFRENHKFLPNTSDWLGRWRLAANEGNDYLIDREVQSTTQSWTGIPGTHEQDQAVTESMGAITDYSKENLGVTDSMIIRTRRRLARAAMDLREGTPPATIDHPELYRTRSGGVILPRDADWVEATKELRRAFVEHPGLVNHA